TTAGCTASSGSADYIQNNTSVQTANFAIQSANTGNVTALLRAISSQSANLLQLNDASNNQLLAVTPTGNMLIQPSTNSTTAFRLLNANGTSNLIVGDTSNARVAIAQPTATYTLDVGGDINSTTAIRVGGTIICQAGGCTPGAGSGDYIQNSTSLQTANFAIQSAANTSVVAIIRGASGQSADLLRLIAGDSGTQVLTVAANGATTFKNDSDSTTAFQIQNVAGNNLIVASTTDSTVTITGLLGSGAGLTSLNASNLSSGTVADARLSSNVALLNGSGPQTFSGNNKFTGTFLHQNASDSTTAFQAQNAAGNNYLLVNTSGATVSVGNTGIASTIQIGNTTGAVAQTLNIGNNAIASSTNTIVLGSTIGTSPVTLQAGTSGVLVKPANSTTAFQIQNSSSVSLFTADTTNMTITLGSASATPVILVLGNKNTAGDPTCTNGGIYYNSSSTLLRGCVNGAWNTIAGTNVVTTVPTTNLFDGRKIKLRAGSSPYEYTTLTYDATYAKWVSDEWLAFRGEGQGGEVGGWITLASAASSDHDWWWFPYRAFYNAGLRLQARTNALTSKAFFAAGTRGADVSGTVGSVDTTNRTAEVGDYNANDRFSNSGWTTLNSSVTTRDFMSLRGLYASGEPFGSPAPTLFEGSTIWARWVSP
ncbi:MAG: hypothetical protein WD877_03200, partial [Candidatus Saccharimonadales bacterium]